MMKNSYMKYALIVLVLMGVVLLTGCTAQQDSGVPQVKTQQEAQKVVENVTQDVSNVQQTLNDIDNSFG